MSGIRNPSLRPVLVTEVEVGALSNLGLVNDIEELDEDKVKVEFFLLDIESKMWRYGCWRTYDKDSKINVLPEEKWNSFEREFIRRFMQRNDGR